MRSSILKDFGKFWRWGLSRGIWDHWKPVLQCVSSMFISCHHPFCVSLSSRIWTILLCHIPFLSWWARPWTKINTALVSVVQPRILSQWHKKVTQIALVYWHLKLFFHSILVCISLKAYLKQTLVIKKKKNLKKVFDHMGLISSSIYETL